MKQNLTIEDIHFIDTYLTKSGIHFTDIKIEMIDHVASEINKQIEDGDTRTFYYIFKDYMVENKSFLMKVDDTFYKASDRKIFKSLVDKTFSIKGVALLLIVFFSFKLLNIIFEIDQVFWIVRHSPFAIMIIVFLGYLFLTRRTKQRYSSLERIGLYFSIVAQIIYIIINPIFAPQNFSNNMTVLEISSTLIIFILIILMVSTFELKKEYQRNYNSVS
jgi:hypothetical protein